MKNTRIVKIVVSILLLVSLIVGFSYARFKFTIESQEINLVQSGCLKIDISEANNININNAIPSTDEIGLKNKPYTFKIKNTCDTIAEYETTFNVLNTSNEGNQEKIKISLKGDSYVQPTIISLLPVATLYEPKAEITNSYLLDVGYILPNQEKNFELRLWIDYDVTEITGSLEGKIIINSKAKEGPGYNTNTSGYTVFRNNIIQNKTNENPNYNYVAPYVDNIGRYTQISGLYKYDNNRYFFRGNILNNYITLGKYQEDETITYIDESNQTQTITHKKDEDIIWRIVGINSDGSLRLILNDLIKYGQYNDEEYVEDYMDGTIYDDINTWLTKHLIEEQKYLIDGYFCDDWDSIDGIKFGAYTRNITAKSPSLECYEEFLIQKKYGLLTVDEAVLAGLKHETKAEENYLYRNYGYWSISLMEYETVEKRGTITPTGISYDGLTENYGIIPVINLSSDAILVGTGTENNKYQVIGLYKNADKVYLDNVAPTIVEATTSDEYTNQNKSIVIFTKDNTEGTGIAGYIIKQTNQVPELNEEWVATTDNKIITKQKYANGTYYVWTKDNSGNISQAYMLIIDSIDLELPTCTITTDKDGVMSLSKTLTINTTSDDVAENGYSWDNVIFKENTPLVVTENKTYTAYVKDKAGNVGNCSITITKVN